VTTIYSYTVNLPYTDPVKNRREYYRIPRSVLLPPYLSFNPYFTDYLDAIDSVFDSTIEEKAEGLRNIRNMFATNKETEAKISNQEMLEFVDWGGPDRATVVSQVNLLGLKLANANLVDENSYRTISKFLGSYWFEKGKDSSIDFLNFCLKTNFQLQKLFTTDYVTFYPEGDSTIGATVYDDPPGPWYPTTHVRLAFPGGVSADPITIGNFFYEIANYNLVLEMIQISYDLYITRVGSDYTYLEADIVCTAAEEIFSYTFATDEIVI